MRQDPSALRVHTSDDMSVDKSMHVHAYKNASTCDDTDRKMCIAFIINTYKKRHQHVKNNTHSNKHVNGAHLGGFEPIV